MENTVINKEQYRQFKQIKQKYPDAIVVLRIADDYTAFDEDAEIIHQLTGNNLTDIPGIGNTCHFPFGDMDTILHRLVKAGNKVAVCDALENPKR